ncbi:MAG: hypothetical protein RBG13Loki_2057 [Promethearchaeota archaeon CR_4]|nr:MAG: hypothetical protein RBG13Loki_2057 [Candidatus Lokiarchaeota archaeon CR_4]
MTLKVNPDIFAKFMMTRGSLRDYPFVFEELMEHFKTKCADCMRDRMVCSLSPMCFRRHYLNLLIKAGAEFEELPQFCYSQQMSNIQRFLQKKRTLYPAADSIIYLKDFLKLAFEGEFKQLQKFIDKLDTAGAARMLQKMKERDKTLSMRFRLTNNYCLLALDESVFLLDIRERITKIDPRREEIFSRETFFLLLELHSEIFQIQYNQKNVPTEENPISLQDEVLVEFVMPAGEISQELTVQVNEVFQSAIDDFIIMSNQVRVGFSPKEIRVTLQFKFEKGALSIERERVTYERVKKMFESLKKITALTRK